VRKAVNILGLEQRRDWELVDDIKIEMGLMIFRRRNYGNEC
jgi:hypothetical protein